VTAVRARHGRRLGAAGVQVKSRVVVELADQHQPDREAKPPGRRERSSRWPVASKGAYALTRRDQEECRAAS
jgi:hypothetical protein